MHLGDALFMAGLGFFAATTAACTPGHDSGFVVPTGDVRLGDGDLSSPDADAAEPRADGGGDSEDPFDIAGDSGGDASDQTDTVDADVGPPALTCPYPPVLTPAVARAVDTGDAASLTSAALLQDAPAYMEHVRTRYAADVRSVLGLDASGMPLANAAGPITWDPTHDGALLAPDFDSSVSLLGANQHIDGPRDAEGSLALLGRRGQGRYLAFGGNPFRNARNDGMAKLLVNGVRWLMNGADPAGGKIVIAHLAQSYYFPDEVKTREYFESQYGGAVSVNTADACDGAALDACLAAAPSMLIVSQDYNPNNDDVDAIVASVAAALDGGVPVIYLQYDGGINPLGERILSLLGARHKGDNYWPKWRLEKYDAAAQVGQLSTEYAGVYRLLTHLRDSDYALDLPSLAADPGRNAEFQAEFAAGARATRELLGYFDSHAISPFNSCGRELSKLLVLIGDTLRRDIVYPMPAATTAVHPFLRAYFADHAVLLSRSVGAAQPRRGNFDPLDHAQTVPQTMDVQLVSRQNFRATGAYLLPGQAATVTRLDANDVRTTIHVNTLHDGATHVWETYARPAFLRSPAIPIAPGETRTITSPYGGPIQIGFDASQVNVSFRFDNVGAHPFWDGPEDDADFAEKLAARQYHWVEVASDGFEVHSRRDLFDTTLKDARWSVPAVLADVMQQYTYSASHVLAGFRGRGLVEEPEVHGWADGRGLPVRTIDVVKHGNMDQARCGYGCSGNPYDAYWSFDPLAHGDLHELGHGLQREILQFQHGATIYENHAATNWTPFYVASRYFDDHGGTVADWRVDPKPAFAAIQAAYVAGEREGTFSASMDSFLEGRMLNDGAIGDAYACVIQAMASAVHAGAVENGYHLIPRIHLLDDALTAALVDDTTWAAGRAQVGLSGLSRTEAEALKVNDRLVVLLSVASGLDYTDFFDMWGMSIGPAARGAVVGLTLPRVPRAFFVIDKNAHKEGALSSRFADVTRIAIDGTTQWPTP